MLRRRCALSFVLCLALWPGVAAADPSADSIRAEALFNEARDLVTKQRFDEACPKFAESQRLEPAPGTQINLADCLERQGKTASAWVTYRIAAQSQRTAGHADRAKTLEQRAKALEGSLFKHTIVVPETARLTGLVVQRDGTELTPAEWGTAIPVDPGAHTITAHAPGHKEWSDTFDASKQGGALTTTLPVLDAEVAPASAPVAPAPAPAPSEPGMSPLRIAGIAVGAAGIVGLGIGLGFGLHAGSRWSDAKSTCSNFAAGECTDPAAIRASDSAHSSATAADVAFVIGGAALVGGLAMFLFAPSTSRTTARVTPLISPSFVGAEGAF